MNTGSNSGSFEFRVGEFCESMAADTRSARQKEELTTAIKALLASNLPGPLTAENLGAAKDSLVNAIAATYPDAPDKLQAFIDALASHMGEAYPLETYESRNSEGRPAYSPDYGGREQLDAYEAFHAGAGVLSETSAPSSSVAPLFAVVQRRTNSPQMLEDLRRMLRLVLKFFDADAENGTDAAQNRVPAEEEEELTLQAADRLEALKRQQEARYQGVESAREELRRITESQIAANRAQQVITGLQGISHAAASIRDHAETLAKHEVRLQSNVTTLQASAQELKTVLYQQYRNPLLGFIPGVGAWSDRRAQAKADRVFATLSEKLASNDAQKNVEEFITNAIGFSGRRGLRDQADIKALKYASLARDTRELINRDASPERMQEFRDFLRDPGSVNAAAAVRKSSRTALEQYKALAEGKDLAGLMELEKTLPPHQRTLTSTILPLQKLARRDDLGLDALPLRSETRALVALLAQGKLAAVGSRLQEAKYQKALVTDQAVLKDLMVKLEGQRTGKQQEVAQLENGFYSFRATAQAFAGRISSFFRLDEGNALVLTGDPEQLRETLNTADDIHSMPVRGDFVLALDQRAGEWLKTVGQEVLGLLPQVLGGVREAGQAVAEMATATAGYYAEKAFSPHLHALTGGLSR